MGTTPSGLVYPDATDPVDVAGDMQELAESVEDALVDGAGWVTGAPALVGFTAAANFAIQAARYRILGALCFLDLSMTRITALLANTTSGNPANTSVLSAIPAAITPAQSQGIGSAGYDTSVSSRGFGFVINSGGTATLTYMGGTADLAINDRVTVSGVYLLN